MSTEWSTELFGCFEDCSLCIITFIVPCYAVGKTAEAVGEQCCLCGLGYMFLGCIVGGFIREKVRKQKGIAGSLSHDFLNHLCCPCCAVIQDNREVVGSPLSEESIARV